MLATVTLPIPRPIHLSEALARIKARLETSEQGGGGDAVAPAGTGEYTLTLEYPPSTANEPRWGWGRPSHPQLAEILRGHHGAFSAAVATIGEYIDDLRRIPVESRGPQEAFWANPSLPGLDGAAIYAFLRDRRPRRYLEVGSGTSTKFAARAKRDGGLTTELISVDPHPWTEIDALCDKVVRSPLESVDSAVFASLGERDVLFFDASHRTFMNSDTVTFFVDVLPTLPSGVLVGVHDIFLPDDYPLAWAERWYSEQYLLACWLLAGAERLAPVLAGWYVSGHTDLAAPLAELWRTPGFERVERHGGAFWFETRG